jgi:hypothetical protein
MGETAHLGRELVLLALAHIYYEKAVMSCLTVFLQVAPSDSSALYILGKVNHEFLLNSGQDLQGADDYPCRPCLASHLCPASLVHQQLAVTASNRSANSDATSPKHRARSLFNHYSCSPTGNYVLSQRNRLVLRGGSASRRGRPYSTQRSASCQTNHRY